MKPISYLDGRVTLYGGDCLRVLPALPENSVDGVVCDPPYHLRSVVERFGGADRAPAKVGKTGAYRRVSSGFMNQQWDGGDIAFRAATWKRVYRVLKPGGYIIAFASSRGYGRMQVAMEAAGFVTHPLIGRLYDLAPAVGDFLSTLGPEQASAFFKILEDADPVGVLGWIFGSGMPKATKIKAAGFDGFRYGGQSLKPALEPIYFGQKPFSEANGTANIQLWGTGAVNIDACRVPTADDLNGGAYSEAGAREGWAGKNGMFKPGASVKVEFKQPPGRWPANLVHDGSASVVEAMPESDGAKGDALTDSEGRKTQNVYNPMTRGNGRDGEPSADRRYREEGSTVFSYLPGQRRNDGGSAARFFYAAKADALDRAGSKHPTVKPLALIQYLVRLITPPGGLVLDPFAGTGTTGEAAWREGMRAILIEKSASYRDDIARRMDLAANPSRRAALVKAKGELRGAEDTPLFTEAAE